VGLAVRLLAGQLHRVVAGAGTYWTAYNGVSEWLTYDRGSSGDNRLNALWFGGSAVLSRHALETALDMAE
jgi:hypothetical protein